MRIAFAQVRPAFWLMLLLALVGSAGMKLLAAIRAEDRESDVQVAVYRYPADAMPDCERLLGVAVRPEQGEDPDAAWARLQVSPLNDRANPANGACRVSTQQVM